MMKINIEIEYKCLVTSAEYKRLLKTYQHDIKTISQTNIYYRDNLNKISHMTAVLRNRIFTSGNTITFKILLDDKLLEIEKDNVDLSDEEFCLKLAEYNLFRPFIEIGEMLTIRRMVDLPEAELCLDENHYCGETDYEIEFELKNEGEHLEHFKKILAEAGITYQPNNLSKYQRTMNASKQV